jgi:cytochrome d ubiquinol oxidase subunit I
MLGLSALELARIQFGFTISFHIIFPAITIGLASYLAVLEGLWLWKQEPVYRNLHHFWARIFAVNFAMGVVSGLVMAYQFGTNWSYYSAFAGSITGPLLTYEVMTPSSSRPAFSASCCSAGTRSDPASTSSRPLW